MDKFLRKLLEKQKERRTALQEGLINAETVEERQAIQGTLNDLDEEIRETEEQLRNVELQNSQGQPEPKTNAQRANFSPIASYAQRGQINAGQQFEEEGTNSRQYRTAFMDLVLRNIPIPQELRANQSTTTTDVSSVIPTVLVNQIIERMEECGMILPLVTRTAYSAGVVIPTSSVKPVATWVQEGKTSDKQKKSTGKITFAYYKLRCEISMSMEVGTMALSAFEAKFVDNVSKAMVIAIEKSIISGNGTSQPKGILKETPAGTVELAKDEPTYKELCDAEGKIPAEFEATAKWAMTKAQFMKFIGMTDTSGQPIARVNYGINGKPERILLGREVVVHPYATEMGNVKAFIVDFADYVLNTIYDMGIQKKQDWDTEDLLTKAVMSVDGKMVDAGSLITLTVKAGG